MGPLEIMPCWHRDRMVLVGDSAHAPSASSGQGASPAARTNSDKREMGFLTRLLMPVVMKSFGAKALTKDQNYRIDWDAQVSR